MLRIAFVGFRHGHIMGLYAAAQTHPRVKLVAACEEDAPTVGALRAAGKVQITHTDFPAMLHSVECDAIAVGDYFAKRGSITIAALKANRHVISDKPICTSLAELEEIEALAREKKRAIGCLLDLRDSGVFRTARRLIQAGEIGEVLTILFTAQHPLLLATRPKWYFEPGKHGGTINDIAVHAIDLLPWISGRRIVEATAARTWNSQSRAGGSQPGAAVPHNSLPPHFHDGAQLMLKMDNGGGVFGDVSYFSPDGLGYTAPQYWRVTIHGTQGMIEASYSQRTLMLARAGDKSPRLVALEEDVANGCLEAFLRDIDGHADESSLRTRDVIDACRRSLLVQSAADESRHNVPLE